MLAVPRIARFLGPVLILAAVVALWRIERATYGDLRFAEGEAARQAEINKETAALNDAIEELERANERLAEELDRETVASEALERQLADEARRDPAADAPGIARDGRLRIEAIH
ncbi:MAG: hypothetical protein AAGP08_07780 [Pseudomonadota bacterium]